MADNDITHVTCTDCDTTVTVDDTGYAVCYGNPPDDSHAERVLVRPCGVCGDPIRTAEICADCADERDTDAFTHPEELWK